jgi:hypothetical protein
VVSLRVPGSYLDTQFPDARVGDDYFRGSGTSQAAAVVSGAAALIVSQRPNITPDQVKSLLMSTARPIPNASYSTQGAGLIDLQAAFGASSPTAGQYWQHSNGSPQGVWWNVADATGNSWSTASSTGNSWSGNSWTGDGWSGPGWDDDSSVDGNSWSTGVWQGVSWGKPKDGPRPKGSFEPTLRGACTDWFLARMGDMWSDKTKKVNAQGAHTRHETGVSWGRKRSQQVKDAELVAFCTWKDEAGNDQVVALDTNDAYRELGVSWGRRTRSEIVWRGGWRVE